VATAAFAVVLQRGIVENTHAHSASDSALLSQSVKLPPTIAGEVARAFAHTFWWTVATIVVALIPTMFLPSHGPAAVPGVATDEVENLIAPVVSAVD
jgi:hypothetical protein